MWRLRPSVVVGAAWALVATRRVSRGLRTAGLAISPLQAPRLWGYAESGVQGVLHRLSPTCLERALVKQAWMAAHGRLVDVVIGVPRAGFAASSAHAWLDGVPRAQTADYIEVQRIAPSRRSNSL
jgi:Transglutaminase-like superfamily